jgi:hypothetical protein
MVVLVQTVQVEVGDMVQAPLLPLEMGELVVLVHTLDFIIILWQVLVEAVVVQEE